MREDHLLRILSLILTFVAAQPASSQIPVVVAGRVVDSVTLEPIPGVRIEAIDSTSFVFTDSIGEFLLPLQGDAPLAVRAEYVGYYPQRFDLAPDAPAKRSVLLMEPAPMALSGVNVVADDAVTELLRDLRRRRNFYDGAILVMDRPLLERFMPAGSAWDLVRQRVPQVFECNAGLSGLCLMGRSRTFSDPFPEVPVLVCVDGWSSWGAVSELSNLPIESVSLVEFYSRGRGGIRVYTASYLAHSARTDRWIATPLDFGC